LCCMTLKRVNRPSAKLSAPWMTDGDWIEINQSFRYLIQRHKLTFDHIHSSVVRLTELLTVVHRKADDLCRSTCRYCPDPCCTHAWAWFDFKDLLFMHLSNLEIPASQTISSSNDHCIYLSARGCRLSRMTRPWVCTWYFCPPQINRLKKNPAFSLEAFTRIIKRIKKARLALEVEFVEISTTDRMS
jgi:hypothetical protein